MLQFNQFLNQEVRGSTSGMISYHIKQIGEDWLISVYGGTKPHIGAVAIAYWDGEKERLFAHELPGHKERELAIEVASVWCVAFRQTVTVTVGIHFPGASKKLIHYIVERTREELFIQLSKWKGDP